MKTLFTFVLVAIFSLKVAAQTTQEEYNYLTKGYKASIENGLDIKKGYRFANIGFWSVRSGEEDRTTVYKALIREGQIKPCAYLMIYKRTDIPNGSQYYICIPTPDAPDAIWNQTFAFVETNFQNPAAAKSLIMSLMKFSSEQMLNNFSKL